MMSTRQSKIISRIELDSEKLAKEIEMVSAVGFNRAYKKYALGKWETCVIWNQRGDQADAVIHDYSGVAVPTALGGQLKYINTLIKHNFNIRYLKFARIFSISDNGLVAPHRDYLELKKNLYRIHIPIQVNGSSFSSEGDHVFQMQYGEVWFLDATQVHSAACFSKQRRLHLVLDFETEQPMDAIFKLNDTKTVYPVTAAHREKVSDKFLDAIFSLSQIITIENFSDITAILAKVHFKKSVHAGEMFKWLTVIANKSRDPLVIEEAKIMYERCVICRA